MFENFRPVAESFDESFPGRGRAFGFDDEVALLVCRSIAAGDDGDISESGGHREDRGSARGAVGKAGGQDGVRGAGGLALRALQAGVNQVFP